MNPVRNKFQLLLPFFMLALAGCVEEVDLATDAESIRQAGRALVVEATLTDSVKTQQVALSRVADFTNDSIIEFDIQNPNTYLFPGQELRPRPVLSERGARVTVQDDSGQTYDFVEGDPGRYFSAIPFGAVVGRAYQLQVILNTGERIISDFESVAGTSVLENLRARRLTDPELGDGIGFFVDSRSTSGGAAYLRYTFEETFKVIAPMWNPLDFYIDPVDYGLELRPREQEEQVCYRTLESDDIALASTEGLSGGELREFRVHFIPRSSFKIAHRYSLMVKQHTGSLGSYLFYDRLRNFSREGNVFSQVQPGFLLGNLRAEAGFDLEVIGYFSVNTVREQRLFLNFEDFFAGEPEPPFVVPCFTRSSPVAPGQPGCPPSIIELLNAGDLINYYGFYDTSLEFGDPGWALCPGPYTYVPRVCGDCTVLGSNTPPDFWIED